MQSWLCAAIWSRKGARMRASRGTHQAQRSLRFMVTGLCRDGDMSGNEFEDEADDAEGFVAAETFDGPRVGTSLTLPQHHK